jgi:methylenetetrahydrofolate dehydrogenase (NADP+)/methenyltetrahydrofolate cyclohydrolase
VAAALDIKTLEAVDRLKAKGIAPTLAILRVGDKGDDISYERGATKKAGKVGIAVKNVLLPADVRQDALIQAIDGLNGDNTIHGVLMLRPLPGHIDGDSVRNRLLPAKDIDGITDISLAGVFSDTPIGYAPCTPSACIEILDYFSIGIESRSAVVVGRSLVVGKPIAVMLLKRNATVTITHSRTARLQRVVGRAEIVIACVGRAQMIDSDYLREGQVVIDVGINVDSGGRLVGDVDFEDAEDIVAAITPVPGGVGAVTTSVLMKHVSEAAEPASCKAV